MTSWLPHKLEQQVEILGIIPRPAMVYGVPATGVAGPERRGHRPKTACRNLASRRDALPRAAITPACIRWEKLISVPSDLLLRRATCKRVGGFEESSSAITRVEISFLAQDLPEEVFRCASVGTGIVYAPTLRVDCHRNGQYSRSSTIFYQLVSKAI